MFPMPGSSHRGPLPPLEEAERLLAEELERHILKIAVEIGPRNMERYLALEDARAYIEHELRSYGLVPALDTYAVAGRDAHNIVAEIEGDGAALREEIILVGAHYDGVGSSPAANDNASGVAALLALAKRLVGQRFPRTLRLVAFVNEEPPWAFTDSMGSRVHARRCRARGDRIVAMFSLETIGYYTDEARSQEYPAPFSLLYPSTGNFIGFVGNIASRKLVRRVVGSFRRQVRFPSEGGAVPGGIPGVGWSDHSSFWREGYPALMVTDTAPFRYPYYHTVDDTPDKLDYERMARVVRGLELVLADLLSNGVG